MPDVFEVLRKHHDEVKAMLAKLEDGPKASRGATAEQLAQRKRLVDDLIIEQSEHEAAEQQYFWPMVRALGPEGDRVADQAIEQETKGESVLDQLNKLDPDDLEFETALGTFTSDARAHIAFEEAHAWPLLRAALSSQQAGELGEKIIQAKKLAPTRPHPHTPPKEGVQKTVGPMAGAADRLRDAVTGRGHQS
jgi:hypothetical protein